MKVDFELIKREAKPFFEEAIAGHDWFHVKRVFNLSKHICKKEGINFNVVGTAALLHDLARKQEEEGKIEDHAIEGAKQAKKILKKLGYEGEFIEKVAYCIEVHSYSKSIKPETREAQVLQDADRLDVLGAIGIARVFAYGGMKKRPLYADEKIRENLEYKSKSSSSLVHFYEKILKIKPESFNTKTAQEIAKKRFKFTKNFVETFLKEWKGIE